ncbi:AAA family ATPase [Priestia megaterium]
MLINSFAIQGYKSIKKLLHIDQLKNVNLFMGPNNVGKSNIFSILKKVNEKYSINEKTILLKEDARFNKSEDFISLNVSFDSSYFILESEFGYPAELSQESNVINFWKNSVHFIDISASSFKIGTLINLLKNDALFSDNISKWITEVLNEKVKVELKHGEGEEQSGYKVQFNFENSIHQEMVYFDVEELGAGVTLVLCLIMAIYMRGKKSPCSNFFIEEPERYLHNKTIVKLVNLFLQPPFNTHRFFINTHSNALIDLPSNYKSLYRVYFDSVRSTKTQNCTSIIEKHALLDSLGVKPSQVFQSNYLIWVEGPSDRIYINKWISQKDNKLIEGVHYTIMYYGGRLLSHLSADDQEVLKFININKIGKNKGIIFDSDFKNQIEKKQFSINDTKKRVRKEFSNIKEFTWVTECREIENYISSQDLKRAIEKTHGKDITFPKFGKFEKVTKYYKDGVEKSIDKVEVARVLCEKELKLSKYNLEYQISSLVENIRKANY